MTGDEAYEQWYQRFWDYAKNHLIDTENGSWWQELSPENVVSTEVWDGKPESII